MTRTCDNVPVRRPVLLGVAIVDVDVRISNILCVQLVEPLKVRLARRTSSPRDFIASAWPYTKSSLMSHYKKLSMTCLKSNVQNLHEMRSRLQVAIMRVYKTSESLAKDLLLYPKTEIG